MELINKIKSFIYLKYKAKSNDITFTALPALGNNIKIIVKKGNIIWGKTIL